MKNGFQAQLSSKCHPSSEETDYSLYRQLLCQILLALFHQSHPRHPGEKQTPALHLALSEALNEKQLPFDAIYKETEVERQLYHLPASCSLHQSVVHRGQIKADCELKTGGELSREYTMFCITQNHKQTHTQQAALWKPF